MSGSSEPTTLILVGVRGFGQVHANRIAELSRKGTVQLVATVDPIVVAEQPSAHGAPLYAELDQALAATGPVDVVIIAAPLGDHFALASTALRARADVYLEKPPVATAEDFQRLLQLEAETGRVVQVGFQSLGVPAAERFAEDAFGIGPVVRVGAIGAWSRTAGYWNRSPWAGHRVLDGRPVVDGVITNPLAHAVATALAIAGARTWQDVRQVTTDLYRANAIESDDTSVVRIETATGLVVTCALTLCAEDQREPVVRVEGSRGRATFFYTTDRMAIETADGEPAREEGMPRTDLVENLLDHRRDGTPLLVPLASTGAFMRVLDAVAQAADPTEIDARSVQWEGEEADRRPIVTDVEQWLEKAVSTGQTFTELGVPWTVSGADRQVKRERVLAVLDQATADAVLLTSATALNWYLDGARTHVSLAADPVIAVRVGRDGDEVLITDNETPRLVAEELPPGMTVRERPWYAPLPEVDAVQESALTDQLRQARSPLLSGETDRFRRLGRDAAVVLTDALHAAGPSWSERQLAGAVAHGLVAGGMEPLVVLVGGESRTAIPHPLPTDAPVGNRALVVVCARRHGLIANLSRLVAFGPLSPAERQAMSSILRVEQAAFDATVPGATLGNAVAAIGEAYAAEGFGVDHWRGHHQGGVAGYAGRDPRALPDSDELIRIGQAFAWNPWAPGAKVEDTVLLTDRGLEVLTVDPRWPTVEVGGIARPVILER